MGPEESRLFELIDKLAKEYYDDPDGRFGNLKSAAFDNKEYDALPENDKNTMRGLIASNLAEELGLVPDSVEYNPLTKESNVRFWRLFDCEQPTDNVIFDTFDDMKYIGHYWNKGEEVIDIPSDLFISGNIPIRSIIITYEGKSYDVRIFSDYKKRIDRSMSDKKKRPVIVGGVTPDSMNSLDRKETLAFVLLFDPKTETIITDGYAYLNIKKKKPGPLVKHTPKRVTLMIMKIWYGIQVSLLNPITERVFIDKRNTAADEKTKTKYRGTKIMYVKRYYVYKKDLETSIHRHISHDIKCTLWYVIGHWRQYKSGNRIWIEGFWKGVDRDKINKYNECIIRERILDYRTCK